MNAHRNLSLVFGLLIVCSQAGNAQLPTLSITPVESRAQEVTLYGNTSMAPVTGEPYSAVEESLYSRRESDGTYQARSSITTHFSRDGQGRTRAERYVTSYLAGKAGESRLSSIYIADPVVEAIYRLDPNEHTATRSTWNPYTRESSSDVETMADAAASPNLQIRATTESLGSETREGLAVEGTRQTLAVPEGANGNDHSYKIVLDTWYSPELKVAAFSQRDTSAGNRRTTRLTKIDRSAPNAALFEVPSDYIVEDAPVVTISGSAP